MKSLISLSEIEIESNNNNNLTNNENLNETTKFDDAQDEDNFGCLSSNANLAKLWPHQAKTNNGRADEQLANCWMVQMEADYATSVASSLLLESRWLVGNSNESAPSSLDEPTWTVNSSSQQNSFNLASSQDWPRSGQNNNNCDQVSQQDGNRHQALAGE